MYLHEFCIVENLQLLCSGSGSEWALWNNNKFTSTIELDKHLTLHLTQTLELVNTQNFFINSASNIINENVKIFRTPHRTEILTVYLICMSNF